jgi:hypothetical protein
MLAIAFSTVSIKYLVNVYVNSGENLQLQLDAVYQPPSEEIFEVYQNRQKQNKHNANLSYDYCLSSWLIVISVIFWATFTVDFTKQKDDKINKTEIFNKSMANTNQNTNTVTANSVASSTKSLESSAHSAFAMAALGQSKPAPQPQPESTTKQPSNKQ